MSRPGEFGRSWWLAAIATQLVAVTAWFGAARVAPPLVMPAPIAAEPVRIQFAPAVEAPPAPEPQPEVIPEITPDTQLAQAVDRPAEPDPSPPARSEEAAEPPARRVYGVSRVMARGLGGTGSGPITARGNSLAADADSVEATDADLVGTLGALSTVDQAPQPVHRVRPRYSDALREAGAEGTVRARLLVDVDGSVRRVEIVSDIGLDSGEVAALALRQFRFTPARRDGEPIAVWIPHRIRFEFQE